MKPAPNEPAAATRVADPRAALQVPAARLLAAGLGGMALVLLALASIVWLQGSRDLQSPPRFWVSALLGAAALTGWRWSNTHPARAGPRHIIEKKREKLELSSVVR